MICLHFTLPVFCNDFPDQIGRLRYFGHISILLKLVSPTISGNSKPRKIISFQIISQKKHHKNRRQKIQFASKIQRLEKGRIFNFRHQKIRQIAWQHSKL